MIKDQIIQDFQKQKKQFKKICNEIVLRYSKKDKKSFQRKKPFQDSKILEDIKDKQLLFSWIKQIPKNQSNLDIQTKLLFRASEHGFKKDQFHKFCDGINDTVVIAKNQYDFVIGGFVHPKYFIGADYAYAKDDKNQSFLFSINAKEKIKCTQPQFCIKTHSSYGPILGGNSSDFYIIDNANISKASHFNPFNAYHIGNKYGDQNQTRRKLSGDPNYSCFLIKQYQVYQIKNLI